MDIYCPNINNTNMNNDYDWGFGGSEKRLGGGVKGSTPLPRVRSFLGRGYQYRWQANPIDSRTITLLCFSLSGCKSLVKASSMSPCCALRLYYPRTAWTKMVSCEWWKSYCHTVIHMWDLCTSCSCITTVTWL
jgi:hypothetical protein